MSFRKPFRSPPVRPGPVYRKKVRREWAKDRVRIAFVMVATATAVFIAGMAATNWSAVASVAAPVVGRVTGSNFAICRLGVRWNCVVDGDTFWMNGRKIRIADIDTPEISEPKCDSEYQLGMRATHRLRELLNGGPFSLEPIPGRDTDKYGRELRVVVRDGRSLGDQLVSEGLARTWSGRREPWC